MPEKSEKFRGKFRKNAYLGCRLWGRTCLFFWLGRLVIVPIIPIAVVSFYRRYCRLRLVYNGTKDLRKYSKIEQIYFNAFKYSLSFIISWEVLQNSLSVFWHQILFKIKREIIDKTLDRCRFSPRLHRLRCFHGWRRHFRLYAGFTLYRCFRSRTLDTSRTFSFVPLVPVRICRTGGHGWWAGLLFWGCGRLYGIFREKSWIHLWRMFYILDNFSQKHFQIGCCEWRIKYTNLRIRKNELEWQT